MRIAILVVILVEPCFGQADGSGQAEVVIRILNGQDTAFSAKDGGHVRLPEDGEGCSATGDRFRDDSHIDLELVGGVETLVGI